MGGDVAGDHLHAIGMALHAIDRLQHQLRMAVRGVDHQHVYARLDQRQRPLEPVIAHRRGGADAQAALLILGGMGKRLRLFEIFHRDEADAIVVAIDHHDALNAMLVQKRARLGLVGALAHRDQTVLRH